MCADLAKIVLNATFQGVHVCHDLGRRPSIPDAAEAQRIYHRDCARFHTVTIEVGLSYAKRKVRLQSSAAKRAIAPHRNWLTIRDWCGNTAPGRKHRPRALFYMPM
ncbi:hypothetical protein THICB3180066 [Thiomonas sp. CB3]|nr:hypothetical protein THICB3180066 [Thiomonas sp. CB3]